MSQFPLWYAIRPLTGILKPALSPLIAGAFSHWFSLPGWPGVISEADEVKYLGTGLLVFLLGGGLLVGWMHSLRKLVALRTRALEAIIQEHKQTELALRASEEKYRQAEMDLEKAQSVARLGSWKWDLKTSEVYWSDEMYRIFGIDKNSYTGRLGGAIQKVIHPDDLYLVLPSNAGTFAEKKPVEYRIILPDGSIRHIWALSGDSILDEQGKPLFITGIAQDITERKLAEEAILQTSNRLNSYFNLSTAGISISSPSKGWLEANDCLCSMLGYPKDELLKTTWAELTHPDDLERDFAQFNRVMSGEINGYSIDKRFIRKNGEVICTSLSVQCVRKADGSVDYFVALLFDITGRRQAEEQVKLLANFPAENPNPVMRIQLGGRIDFANAASLPILSAWERTVGQDVPEEWQKKIQTALESGRHTEEEMDCKGEIFLCSLAPMPEKGYLNLYGREITQRVQVTRELERQKDELARSNAELEQFAYVASHDLQEPLRMVSSFMQLIKNRYKGRLDQDADEFIDFAVDGSMRMQNLINDLLLYSRVGTRGKPFEPVACETVLEQVLISLSHSITESKARITHDPLPVLSGDESQLGQLFQNLLSNAIKFHGARAPRIHISVTEGQSEWVFSVRDNGIGFEQKHAERIFQMFQRLHERTLYSGTGIGLAICKKIVERHGGRIWVTSKPKAGSTFYFSMPKQGAGI